MKSADLRIGNMVLNRKNKPVVIDSYEIRLLSDWERNKYSKTPPIKPVPITEDILLKFGFKNTGIWEDYMPYYALNGVLLFFNESRTEHEKCDYLGGYGECRRNKYHCTSFRWINSVHELQNLYFALTGTELTIK